MRAERDGTRDDVTVVAGVAGVPAAAEASTTAAGVGVLPFGVCVYELPAATAALPRLAGALAAFPRSSYG